MKSVISNLKSRLKVRRPNNLRVIVLSVGTAAVFWLFNALNKEYDTTVGYPVSWQFDPETYIVVDPLPKQLQLNVKGLGWTLLRTSLGLRVSPIPILLSNPAENQKLAGVSLTNRVADALEDLQLNYILDDTLTLNIDRRYGRSFSVQVDSVGISLKENYRIISPISLDTNRVEIEGPESLLKAIKDDKFFVRINETDIAEDFDDQLNFEIERPELFLFRPKSTHVKFSVAEFVEVERAVVVEQINIPKTGHVSLTDSICTVQFLVRKEIENTVMADSFKVIADFKRIIKKDSTLILKITKRPPELVNVRLALPQVPVKYE